MTLAVSHPLAVHVKADHLDEHRPAVPACCVADPGWASAGDAATPATYYPPAVTRRLTGALGASRRSNGFDSAESGLVSPALSVNAIVAR